MITVELVKSELDSIIEQYPDNRGVAPTEEGDEDGECVYYLNARGNPNTYHSFYEEDELSAADLVTPVCIVGRWIEQFHPELKENDLIKLALLKNNTVRSLYDTGNLTNLDTEVLEVLSEYQQAQDSSGTNTWRDIPGYLAI